MALDPIAADVSAEALVADARAGDRTAFAALMARDRGLVYAYAFAQLGSREDAEDVVQETFVRAYQSLHRLRGRDAWQAWLMQIARNLCRDVLRRKRVRRTEPIDPEWIDDTSTPEVQVLADERRRALRSAVLSLPEECRVPILMRMGSGCTRQEIAVALGVPESTVVGRLARAMRLLRRQLGEE